VLLKFLGERGAGQPVQAAAVVSVPYDLAAGALALESSPMGRLYALYFLRSLRRKVRWKEALLAGRVPVARVLAARTIRDFDELATAPLHGFRDADHYYGDSSSASYLHRVATPTLLLHALDDPFLPAAALPLPAMRKHPHLVLGVVDRGGHVGFMEGPPHSPRFWAEAEAARFLAAALALPGRG
jgi:predicted alpha/beta-fold hydrolase